MKKIKISEKDYQEYLDIATNIINHSEYQKMKNYNHHAHVSCYDHSVYVGLRAFIYGKKHNLNYQSMTKAALLHDFYLYDWHDPKKGFHFHGYKHPKIACNNATKYFGLTNFEKNIIIAHMFPLTLFHIPKSKEGWAVCMIDKKCSHDEYHNKRKKVEIIS